MDAVTRDFGGQNRQRAFFDVWVFNPFARCYSRLLLPTCYCVHEQEKGRTYDEQIWEVERTCFSPLVFAATGGMGPTATSVYMKLASMLAEQWNNSYSWCLFWVRCCLCFSLLKSGVMCLRGHRSAKSHLCQLMLIWRVTLMLGPLSELFQLLVSSSCAPSAEGGRQGQSI